MAIFFLLVSGWFLGVARLSVALDRPAVNRQYLVNSRTGGQITLNGVWYMTTNASGSDDTMRDSLQDAEACRRDAALMKLLGINLINVYANLDLSAYHDDCFSIFNAVQIYVLLIIPYDTNSEVLSDPASIYAEGRLRKIFQTIDVVKNYENLLGVLLSPYPEPGFVSYASIDPGREVTAAKAFRALVRDVREYVIKNSAQEILLGTSIGRTWEININPDNLMWLTCNVTSESVSSAIDVLYFSTGNLRFSNKTHSRQRVNNLRTSLRRTGYKTPMLLADYKTLKMDSNDSKAEYRYYTDNETVSYDNSMFFGPDALFTYMRDDPIMGFSREQWSNVATNPVYETANLVTIDDDGNVQLTWRFDNVSNVFRNVNVEGFIDRGPPPATYILPRPSCASDLIKNKSTTFSGTTYSLPTDWELPTRPAQIDDLINKGAGGNAGKMVDVTITTLQQEIRDSSGQITTVLLKPTASQSRTTSTYAPQRPKTETLSTGAKAGVGVGSAVGALAIIGGALLVYRRRKQRKASVQSTEAKAEGANGDDGFMKPELPSDNVHEKSVNVPLEAPGDGYLAELPQSPLQKPPQELPGTQVGD